MLSSILAPLLGEVKSQVNISRTNSLVDKSNIDIKSSLNSKSISTDPLIQTIVDKLHDPTLGQAFIKKAITEIGFADVASIAQFALNIVKRDGGNAGKLFVSVCNKSMNKY